MTPEQKARVSIDAPLTVGGCGDVERLPVPLPPVAEQARIVAEIDRHLPTISEVKAEVDSNLQRAHALRQATLANCFRSEVG